MSDVTSGLREYSESGDSSADLVDLDGGVLDDDAPFAVRQATTTTPGVGSWLRDRYPSIDFGWPVIFGILGGVIAAVAVIAAITATRNGSDVAAIDNGPSSGSATSLGTGDRGTFANEGSSSNFKSSASKRFSRASGAAGKEEALAELQARRELREKEEAEAATDGDVGNDEVAAGTSEGGSAEDATVTQSQPESDDLDAETETVGAGGNDSDDSESTDTIELGSGSDTNGQVSEQEEVATTSTASATTPLAPTSPSVVDPEESSDPNPVTPINPPPVVTTPIVTTPLSTTAAPTTTIAPTTTVAPTTTTTTTAPTTTTTTPPETTTTTTEPVELLIAVLQPANQSSHNIESSITFSNSVVVGAAEYCWRFRVRSDSGSSCTSGRSITLSSIEDSYDTGRMKVSVNAYGADGENLAKSSINITLIGDDDDD